MTYSFTTLDRQKSRSDEARERAREAVAHRQDLQCEDVVLLRRRGLVPLAVADELGISLARVVRYLTEAGERIPGYLTTWNAPLRDHERCERCGR